MSDGTERHRSNGGEALCREVLFYSKKKEVCCSLEQYEIEGNSMQ